MFQPAPGGFNISSYAIDWHPRKELQRFKYTMDVCFGAPVWSICSAAKWLDSQLGNLEKLFYELVLVRVERLA